MAKPNQNSNLVDNLDLEIFFDESRLITDLREGVIWNPAKTRVCLLSADLLTGVYKGLVDEAGPAWRIIFKNCGLIWGERVAIRLDRECQLLAGIRVGDLPLEKYLTFMTNYFSFHGWGILTMDVTKAKETGLVEAKLTNSVFASTIQNEEDMVDPMISGILASMLSYLSGHKLDAEQTVCSSKGAPASMFIITGGDRLKPVETMLAGGSTHEQILSTI